MDSLGRLATPLGLGRSSLLLPLCAVPPLLSLVRLSPPLRIECLTVGARKPSPVARSSGLMTNSNSVSVGVVSDYDLLALDSISGSRPSDASLFPEVDRTWKTFNEIQTLLGKTNGKVISDVMTPAPLVVRETTNLEDAARLLLETKYRRLPVVDSAGRLVGIITRGNVVRAALHIKRASEN
ncbi:hypothetical protein QJS10_CPA05g01369 [Acorus calamus]|uniref:CBS domain-containing protein n=1 Tax=Acorus calamus TaxID=4465 RepID=A0AAV9EVT9_ACOCL|nr:hypothetical protein QJS10_CPA05g01369 [Acorus calamus]